MVIREYNEQDIDQIINLDQTVFSQQEHFALNRDRKWFEWKNVENP